MIEIDFDNVAYFDVDDTLLMYNIPPERMHEAINVAVEGSLLSATVIPHHKHVELVKLHKAWGNGVIVWSRSGVRWAKAAVVALGLTEYVDGVMSKPFYYYDDKTCCQILGEHRYKEDK